MSWLVTVSWEGGSRIKKKLALSCFHCMKCHPHLACTDRCTVCIGICRLGDIPTVPLKRAERNIFWSRWLRSAEFRPHSRDACWNDRTYFPICLYMCKLAHAYFMQIISSEFRFIYTAVCILPIFMTHTVCVCEWRANFFSLFEKTHKKQEKLHWAEGNLQLQPSLSGILILVIRRAENV